MLIIYVILTALLLIIAVFIYRLLKSQKELEEKLRKEQGELGLIISSMGEGLLVIDNEFKVRMINPAAEVLLGVMEKDVVGKNWSDLASTYKSSSATPLGERSFSKAINEGKITITELGDDHYYKTRSGKIFPIISITAPLKRGDKVVGAVKVFRDATREKSARAAIEKEVTERTELLWQERARMLASINSLNMGFIIADKNHSIVVKNPAVAEILKLNDSEITLSKLNEELKSNLDLLSLCDECIAKAKPVGRDNIYYKDKFLRLYIAPVIVAENQETAGYVLLLEDVTSEKQLARAKDEFFAVASHELRTPLTAIRGNTSLIMDYFSDKLQDNDLKEMIKDTHESSVRLIEIVNDFLDASRLEQGKVEFKKENFDLVAASMEVVHEVEDIVRERGLVIKFEGESSLEVVADKARSEQIVMNLIGNAVKYSKEGAIRVIFEKNGKFAKASVVDQGTGISTANQRLLFRKFQQAQEKVLARDVTKGTGMGLFISKLLSEGMGGKVYLEHSELGKGSTFVFELPLKS